jgi:hypothetical protein
MILPDAIPIPAFIGERAWEALRKSAHRLDGTLDNRPHHLAHVVNERVNVWICVAQRYAIWRDLITPIMSTRRVPFSIVLHVRTPSVASLGNR